MTATAVAPGLRVPGQVCTGGHISGTVVSLGGHISRRVTSQGVSYFQGEVLPPEESCHQAVTFLGQSHLWGSHISGRVTFLGQSHLW